MIKWVGTWVEGIGVERDKVLVVIIIIISSCSNVLHFNLYQIQNFC